MEIKKACLIVGLALSAPASIWAQGGPSKDVVVVNTPAHPVPVAPQGTTVVSGTVAVTSMPAVTVAPGATVAVTSMPAVTVAPGATVGVDPSQNTVRIGNLASDPALVRSVDEGSRQPFQWQFSISHAEGTASGEDSFTVPGGKRFVIEYASMRGNLPPGQTVFVNIETHVASIVGSSSATHTLLVVDQGMYGVIHLIGAAQQLRLYAEPGTAVKVFIVRDPSAGAPGSAYFSLTLSGYFVDVP